MSLTTSAQPVPLDQPADAGDDATAVAAAAENECAAGASVVDRLAQFGVRGSVPRRREPSPPPSPPPPPVHEPSEAELEAATLAKGRRTLRARFDATLERSTRASVRRRADHAVDAQIQAQAVSRGVANPRPQYVDFSLRAEWEQEARRAPAFSEHVELLPEEDQDLFVVGGAVRGKKQGVRSKMTIYMPRTTPAQSHIVVRCRAEERGMIVVYTTSVHAVRATFESCALARRIFDTL